MMSPQEAARILGGDVHGNSIRCPGPGHSPADRSMSVTFASSAPHGILVHSFSPADTDLDCKDYAMGKLGIDPKANGHAGKRKVIATYDYRLEDGTPYLRVNRTYPKCFWQQHWNGSGWVNGKPDGPMIPYRLPELLAAEHDTVLIVEGEKDVDNVAKLGFTATTNAGGAGKWPPELAHWFKDREVYILPDNDPPGDAHAKKVFAALAPVAKSVRIVSLCVKHKDVSAWIAAGGTADELARLLNVAASEAPPISPEPERGDDPWNQNTDAEIPDLGDWDAGDDVRLPPPRQWLLGNQFCRRFLSGVLAPGGTGKTALRLLQCISLATGRPLTGQHVFKRSRVLIVSLEDDKEELQRRIAAACIHHGVDRSELKGWLFLAAPKGFKLAEVRNGSRQIGILDRMLRNAIERRKPDLITFDPFIKLHALEENDNGAMDFVSDLLVQLAIQYDVAVDAPHHTRKGQIAPGDPDAGRGASAARDAGRLVYTLTRMTEEDAKAFGIRPEERNLYVRLDSGKVNIAPPSGEATWFKLVGVPLGNGTRDYPAGDEVQTVVPWHPPKTWDGVTSAQLNAALTEIETGMPNGQRYSNAPKAANRAAWPVIQRHCRDRTEAQCREIIGTWVKNKVLYDEDYDDPVDRKPRKGLRVDNSKRPGTRV